MLRSLIIITLINLACSNIYAAQAQPDEKANFDKGITAFSVADYSQAKKLLEPIAKSSSNARLRLEALYYLAQANYKEHYYELTKKYIDKALQEPNITGIQSRLFTQLDIEVSKFTHQKSYQESEIENLSRLQYKVPNRKLKIRIQGDNLNDSYEGLILRYQTELKDKNYNLAHTILNTIAEIAYTKEGHAKADPKIAEYLKSRGFTLDEIRKKLSQFKYDRDRSLIFVSEV